MERRYGLCAAENILGDEKYMVRDEMYTVGDDEKWSVPHIYMESRLLN